MFLNHNIKNNLKNYKATIVITLIVIFYSAIFFNMLKNNIAANNDFKAFYTGAYILKTRQPIDNLYDLKTQEKLQQDIVGRTNHFRFLPFMNLPISLVPYLPLLNLDYYTAYVVSILTIFVILMLFNYHFLKDSLLIALFSAGTVYTILQVQINFIMYIALFFVYLSIQKNKDFLAGLLSAVMLLKFSFLPVVPFLFLLAKNKSRYLSGFFISSCIYILSNLMFMSIEQLNHIDNYLNIVHQPLYGSTMVRMYSIQGLLSLFLEMRWNLVVSIIIYAVTGLVFWIKSKKSKSQEYFFCIALLLAPIFNLHSNNQDLIVSTLGTCLLFTLYKKGLVKVEAATAAVTAFVLLPSYFAGIQFLVIFVPVFLIVGITLMTMSEKLIITKELNTIQNPHI